jgi:hypothetical protein
MFELMCCCYAKAFIESYSYRTLTLILGFLGTSWWSWLKQPYGYLGPTQKTISKTTLTVYGTGNLRSRSGFLGNVTVSKVLTKPFYQAVVPRNRWLQRSLSVARRCSFYTNVQYILTYNAGCVLEICKTAVRAILSLVHVDSVLRTSVTPTVANWGRWSRSS